jgi:hypothetical protein
MKTDTEKYERPRDVGEYEQLLKAKHSGRLAKVPLTGPGYAYFRAPTNSEWDELSTLGAEGGEQRQIAFRRLVVQCFIGAFTPVPGAIESWDTILGLEGPGFPNGAAGTAVNKLAGLGERPTTYF